MMTIEEATRMHWIAQRETYAEAAKEIARERFEWKARGYVIPPEVDASDRRRFTKYLRLARQAKAQLDAMEKREAA